MNERYMIVSYVQKPNGKYDELTEFKRYYRSKHIQTAKVILDLEEKKILDVEPNVEDALSANDKHHIDSEAEKANAAANNTTTEDGQ
jgi:hypothetical protein